MQRTSAPLNCELQSAGQAGSVVVPRAPARAEARPHRTGARRRRTGHLAAPVRGQRHGGYICVDTAAGVPHLRDALTRRSGFPDVRVPPQPLPGRGAGGASFQRA
ncbi:DUF6302 family protein [Streptomyces sp. NPDC051243]|uniref:DUF6302 family protein n=1 Tax=Streptomyces sp. NPDC051243 TaxID=3365646 RepID=UPI003791C6BB